MKVIYTLFLGALIGACFGDPVPRKNNEQDQAEVMFVSGLMWLDVDNDGDDIELDLQDKYKDNSNAKYSKLVKSVEEKIFEEDTVKALNSLFKVYDTEDTESKELDDFVDKVLKTHVMETLYEYLNNETIVKDEKEFKQEFKRIWFDSYEYDDVENKTSGFNHVYMGELNDTGVHGFHNWVRYYNEEKEGRLSYGGWRHHATVDNKMELMDVHFEWEDAIKPISTISFGTRPEYEMAVLTLCFYKLPGDECYVAMGNYVAKVESVVAEVDGKDYIRTAYFAVTESTGASSVVRPDVLLSIVFSFLFSWRNFAL